MMGNLCLLMTSLTRLLTQAKHQLLPPDTAMNEVASNDEVEAPKGDDEVNNQGFGQ